MISLENIELKAAHSNARFPMVRGSFQYDEQFTQETELGQEYLQISPECSDCPDAKKENQEESRGFVLRIDTEKLMEEHPEGENWNRYFLRFRTDPEEHYYGCGETFSEFDLKGQRVRVWVAEHQNIAKNDEKLDKWEQEGHPPKEKLEFSRCESYYVQPTFVAALSGTPISDLTGAASEAVSEADSDAAETCTGAKPKCWYLHIDTTGFTVFDFTEPGWIGVEMSEPAPVFIESAEGFSELSGKLAARLGTVPLPPEWTLDGIILGIQQGPVVIEEKLAKCRQHGIKVAGIWSQDWCGCRRTGFGYQVMWNWEADDGLYPDLREHILKWQQEGIRFLGYINPFMAIEKELYFEASRKGYCVKDKEGKDYLVTITTFPAAMIDLTNPDAYEWYKDVIKKNMIGIGMGGWMADFGEYLPTDAVLFDGSDPMLIHNDWPAIWAKLNREAIEECGKLGDVFFFTRAGFTDTIRYSTMMWNGDQHVDWSIDDGIASVIPATLSLAMSGYGIAHSDVGGYTTIRQMTRGKELFMRWAEMCVFSPMMRTHEGNQPTRSIQFDGDEEMLDHLAECVRRHLELKPYLQECLREEAECGVPVMRPLFYHYDEPEAYTESYEYLLGRDILVAPVIAKGARTREVYLPEDTWIHLPTGREYRGGHYTLEAPLGEPPVFRRNGT